MAVIILNGLVLGAVTFESVATRWGAALERLDKVFLAFFTVEVVIGLIAYAPRTWRYFASGWNIFDFTIVVAAYIPGLRENITIIRLLRLARIARLLRNIPSLRIILVAAKKAVPKSVGLFALMGVIMYLWAMLGWMAFGEDNPEQFGSIGQALLTLLQMVALDSIGNVIRTAMAHSLWAVPYCLTFIVFGAFLLLNILIGVVLASMEEAQKIEEENSGIAWEASDDTKLLLARLEELQNTVDRLAERRTPVDGDELERVTARD